MQGPLMGASTGGCLLLWVLSGDLEVTIIQDYGDNWYVTVQDRAATDISLTTFSAQATYQRHYAVRRRGDAGDPIRDANVLSVARRLVCSVRASA
jgi:hypothetical protein